ncbi:MAG TPA: alpha-1,2-fucosyltransferase [Puia sp.]|nr:alpha-1,2-fucosyltransferase [Puia sp.]
MDVILIFNGLGNQMSQYAFFLKKKQVSGSARFIFEKKSKGIHNGYELDKVFGIKEQDTIVDKILYFFYLGIAYKKLRFISQPIIRLFGLLGFAVYNENDNYAFRSELLQSSSGIKFYVGGWHSDKYFRDIKDRVLDTFQFDAAKIGTANLEVLEKIRACTSVSVHVRRGDFLDAKNYHKLGSVCTLNYFLCAIRKMRTLVENPHFFFFTNDYSWVRDNFIGEDFTIININAAGDSWKDMFLMSNCAHNINSNGSFSWWSSYLNKNENKAVIVPKHFIANTYFEDIYPENWIQLSDY